MTVYAPHLNRCTVQIDNRVFYLNFSKSDFFPYTFLPTDNFSRIQVWCLRIPKLRIRYIQFTVPTVRLSLRTQSTAGIKYTNIRFLHTACALPGKCNRSAKSIFVRLRHDPIVPDMVFRAGQKIDISENPDILSLSWSSRYVPSHHFNTSTARIFSPSTMYFVISNSLVAWDT